MVDTIRCPACRGAKKVAKLGGMMGECNTCKGDGHINAIDKPVPVVAEPMFATTDIISQVGECTLPMATLSISHTNTSIPCNDESVKVDPKKAIYKRKKA